MTMIRFSWSIGSNLEKKQLGSRFELATSRVKEISLTTGPLDYLSINLAYSKVESAR